ncbi:MAG: hypothetical protein SAJ12_08985 [Jaaginema sp. PMC 1079.18]|nr:hypothetical protein [Jaaginema sp. PMC 1080.18]MEC4851135.1 hypothetical protein [Jaaginema sp. PMC 1079.18]MEC4866375.1 hypothetical protein [Jaaginema sp. PMC 1078.18]
MKKPPILIGTSEGIINLHHICAVNPLSSELLRQARKSFGIKILTISDYAEIRLYDEEAENFLGHLCIAFWLPGSMTWLPKGE